MRARPLVLLGTVATLLVTWFVIRMWVPEASGVWQVSCTLGAWAPLGAALIFRYIQHFGDREDGVLAACRRLGIGFVAYSPLGRGFLTGQLKRFEDLAADDFRRISPRFQGDNFGKNFELAEAVQTAARSKGCTAAQLALAWVLAQGEDIVAIPGTKQRRKLDDNLGALHLTLSAAELAQLDAVFPPGVAAGQRYPAAAMSSVNR